MKLASAAILLSIASPLASAASHSGVDPSIEAILTKIEEGDAHSRTLLAKVDTLADRFDSLDKIKIEPYQSSSPKKANNKKRGLRQRRTQGMVPQGMVLAEVLHKVNKLEMLANCIDYDPDYQGSGHNACLIGDWENVYEVIFSAQDKVQHFASDVLLKGYDSIDVRAKDSSVDIKAWSDDVEINASDDVTIIASEDEVVIEAPGEWGSVDIEGNDSVDITAKYSSVDIKAYSEDIRVYASDDINLVASEGSFDIEASSGDVDVEAGNDVNMVAEYGSLDIKPYSDSISISASKDITIEADSGSIEFKASESIDIEASQSVDVVAHGSSVDIEGKSSDNNIDAAGSVIVQGYHVYPQLGFSDSLNSAPASGAEAPANEDTDASIDNILSSLDEDEVPEEEVPESAESESTNSIASASSEDTVSGDTKIVDAGDNSSSDYDDVDDEPEPQSEAEADAKTSAD